MADAWSRMVPQIVAEVFAANLQEKPTVYSTEWLYRALRDWAMKKHSSQVMWPETRVTVTHTQSRGGAGVAMAWSAG